jgi:hypothetical protein
VLDDGNETGIQSGTKRVQQGLIPMFRFIIDSLALASVASFVWMVCQVSQFVT